MRNKRRTDEEWQSSVTISDGSVLQCGLSVLWTQKEYDESPLF